MLSVVLFGSVISCSDDDENSVIDDNIRVITSFEFLAKDNEVLSQDVKAEIDGAEQIIIAEVPVGTNVTALRPTIKFTEGAEVSPKQKEARDFSEPVEYKTIAEDGTERFYKVTVIIKKSSEKRIASFQFLASNHEFLEEDFECQIDEQAKTITGELPYGTDVKVLKPSITVSEGAKVSPGDKEAKDFSKAIEYMVTAEDDSEEKYTVTVTVKAPTDRQILLELYNANPDNTLGWNLEDENISNWDGVFSSNDMKVESLILFEKNITILPKSIGELSNLIELKLIGNKITELPNEIGGLSTLKELSISDNQIKDIPNALWKLTQLESLSLSDNKLTTLDAGVGKLENLKNLGLSNNQLNNLPDAIGNLVNLESLGIFNNQLENIPNTIGNLKKLETLFLSGNQLVTIPPEIGNLTNLTSFYVERNKLNWLPAEIGKLERLDDFRIQSNPLTSIPKEICELDFLVFLKDDIAECEQ